VHSEDRFLAFPITIGKNWDSSEPKCGFSKQTVAILEGLKADYGTFDILADEDVRQVGY
jgi:glutaredoxin-related protein